MRIYGIIGGIAFMLLSFSYGDESLYYTPIAEMHPESGLSQAKTLLNGQEITIELALNDQERAYGLMNRYILPQNRGMLFVFNDESIRRFWMKNTKIPLDILYFDQNGVLIDSVAADPCLTTMCPNYPSKYPAQYVLELAKGERERLGVKNGDRLLAIDKK